jgi:uncharacterized protein (UPF0248 family)
MLGLNTEYAGTDIPAARDVVMQWEKEICVERVILEADATIDVLIYYGNYELRELNLEPCTISWPRPILKAEEQGHNVQKQDSDSVASPLKNPKRDKKYRLNVQEQQTNTKSGSLRRAMDVLDRLLWDGTYDIDEFVVGYTDRHSTLPLEKLALDWVKDTTDENWVPEHKIEYFKRYYDGKSEVLWDKATRLDKIFTKKAV